MANLFEDLPTATQEAETFADLLTRPGLRIERIVSTGQATAPGEWLDQDWDEWVLLLNGAARLTLEGAPALDLRPGDHLLIEAHRRHRVDWTSADEPTMWLAMHMEQC